MDAVSPELLAARVHDTGGAARRLGDLIGGTTLFVFLRELG